MELDDGEQLFFHGHPSWRSMPGFHLKGLVAAVLAGVIAGLLSAAASGAVQVEWVVVGVLVVFAGVLASGLLRRWCTSYTITSRRLAIETGLVARDAHQTRLEQIQNVNLSQSLLERVLDVGTVAFDTAGGAGFEFAFCGVAQPRQLVRTVDRALHERLVGWASG